jgi:hypothetical protein
MPSDLAKSNFQKIDKREGMTFEISEEVFSNNLIINLPILKIGKISATENILKLIKKENYLGLKYLFAQEQILENLKEVLPQYLTLAEAQTIQKPDKLTTFLGLILASFNSLNLDRIFAEITMTRDLPEYLESVKIENIPILGRLIEELQYEVEKY